MTQDEIIEMAKQGHASTRDAIRWAMAQEREACANVCEAIYTGEEASCDWPTPEMCATAIRARGQA